MGESGSYLLASQILIMSLYFRKLDALYVIKRDKNDISHYIITLIFHMSKPEKKHEIYYQLKLHSS